MPDNTIDWGQGSANNDIGWGKGPINNDLSWGMIGEDSYGHDETNLMGGGVGPVNTIAPVISGTAERGETITSTTGTWTGVGTITYAYQWRRNGSNILGATSSTYVLVAADDNADITCLVTATDSEGSRSKLSNTLGPVLGLPYNLTAPVLSGTEQVGETLTTTNGDWQGVVTITFAYQWRRDSVNIGSATSSTYTLVAADYDTNIDCVITATNSLGSTNQASNSTGAIAGIIPVISGVPTISGTVEVLETLTASLASVSGVPTPTSALQWQISNDGVSGWSNIVGETSTTYTIALSDDDKYLRVVQTSTNAEGSDTSNSASTVQVVGDAPSISGVPTFSGTELVGETLTATAASTSGIPIPTRTWKWQRSANGTSGWADISGATSSTYLLDAADENNYVRVVQIETNGLGSDSANSVSSGQILLVSSFIDTFGQPAMGLSLRDLLGTDPNVLRVRRDSDDAEADFKASEVSDGTLLNWVNEAQTLFDENFESSTGWTLRSGATISGGSLNLLNVTNSAEAAYKSFGSIPFQKALITITVTDYVQGAVDVRNLGGGGNTSPNITANGTYTYEITLGDGNTNWGIGTSSGPTTLKVANLKVEQLTANGFVRTWYGQGNALTASQTAASAQPKIVDAGSLVLENGKPAISFNGSTAVLELSSSVLNSQSEFTHIAVNAPNFTNAFSNFYAGFTDFVNYNSLIRYNDDAKLTVALGGVTSNPTYNSAVSYLAQQNIVFIEFNNARSAGNQAEAFINGADIGLSTGGASTGILKNSSNAYIGARVASNPFNGTMQESIMYLDDKSADRATIETSVNDFYSAY